MYRLKKFIFLTELYKKEGLMMNNKEFEREAQLYFLRTSILGTEERLDENIFETKQTPVKRRKDKKSPKKHSTKTKRT
jgi:hypothetical protein